MFCGKRDLQKLTLDVLLNWNFPKKVMSKTMILALQLIKASLSKLNLFLEKKPQLKISNISKIKKIVMHTDSMMVVHWKIFYDLESAFSVISEKDSSLLEVKASLAKWFKSAPKTTLKICT